MRLLHSLVLLATVPASFAACGDAPYHHATGGGGGHTSTTPSCSDLTGNHAGPPPLPATATPGIGGHVAFAISRLLLGDVDRDGTPNVKDGWRQYGFDLDGKRSGQCSDDFA